jgi:hypothetical protein
VPYGDVVPLGFLLKAVRCAAPTPASLDAAVYAQLTEVVRARRQGLLWSYHSGGLPTAIDSALVLQGYDEPAAVDALEVFADEQGRYHPQRATEQGGKGTMRITARNRHWCQPDYATTCLVRAAQSHAGRPPRPSLAVLAAGFAQRSGLYFANPYLTDWALASALGTACSPGPMRATLAAEILAGQNPDGTFGRYDIALSTAFALLSLAALRYNGPACQLAQRRLVALMEPTGLWPEAVPFYSSLAIEPDRLPPAVAVKIAWGERHWQIIPVGGEYHGLAFYSDPQRVISTAVAALALTPAGSSLDGSATDSAMAPPAKDAPIEATDCHPRYRCHDHTDYIRRFALPPYLRGSEGFGARPSPTTRDGVGAEAHARPSVEPEAGRP